MRDSERNHILSQITLKLRSILPKNSRAVLYGSRARGDERPDSDWDLHILIPGKENLDIEEISKYAWPIEQLGLDLGQFFSVLVYSHSGWAKRSFLPFYKNVENDKIILITT